MKFILDTNVISEARKSTCHPNVRTWLAAQENEHLYLSAITVLEIQRGITQAVQRGDKAQAEIFTQWLEDMVLPAFENRVLAVDHLVARQAAKLTWQDARDYRDSLIAATGLVHGAVVVTRNVKHFSDSGAKLLNPWDASVPPTHAR